MNAAIEAFREDACPIGLIGESKSVAAWSEAGELLDEVEFREAEESGYGADIKSVSFTKPCQREQLV